MVEDLSVAAVDVVEGLDESGVDRSLDGHSTGSPFALTQGSTVSGFYSFYLFIIAQHITPCAGAMINGRSENSQIKILQIP